MSISICLADSSVKEFRSEKEVDVLSVAQSISPELAQKTVGAFVNSQTEISDLRTLLKDQDRLKFVTLPSEEALEVVRHSAAHVLAQSVQELWPETKVTIGPVIQDGFYYDFDRPKPFTDEEMTLIEDKMKKILSQKLKIEKQVLPSKKAIELFKKMGEFYKIELIQDIAEPFVSIYKQGEWLDLCRGPHCQHLGQIGAVKVLSHSSCYWRGDENKQPLQRIYATAFHSEKDLRKHLHLLEQAKKKDHRKVSKEMDLFYFHEGSAGQPFFKKSGTIIYNELKTFVREAYKTYNYEEVISPQIYSENIFRQSGHFEFYKDNMYEVSSAKGSEAFLKPMNCPGHCILYKSQKKSYKSLPWRVADFGRLHRFERSGVLHGLTRVRGFCQDDAHIFCTESQLKEEIKSFISMLKQMYASLDLSNYKIDLSTRPQEKMGDEAVWDAAEGALSSALKEMNQKFYTTPGDGAFYGPKLDIIFEDSLKRKWQLGTLQCDFNLPEVFKLSYVSEKNQAEKPVLLHRAVLGSLERFIGIYIEHCAGWFPSWLAPVQVVLMNVSQDQSSYVQSLYEKLNSIKDLRIKMDISSESLSYKIRSARTLRIPYMIIVGKKEVENQNISVRVKEGKTFQTSLEVFLSKIKKEIIERKVGYSSF